MNDVDFTNHHILVFPSFGWADSVAVMFCEDGSVYVSTDTDDDTGQFLWGKRQSPLETGEEVDALIDLLQRLRDSLPSQKGL